MPAKKGCSTNFVLVDGIRFYKTKQGYYCSAKAGRLHRYVWEKEHGKVPEYHDIHHLDGDKDNNDISNLICVDRYSHHAYHIDCRTDELVERMNSVVRPCAVKWHKSDEGRAWHRKHYMEVTAPLRENLVTKTCIVCGNEYQVEPLSANKSKFCSNNCKSKYRRMLGVDNEERICSVCGKPFTTNKYSKAKTCSSACSVTSANNAKQLKYHHQP